MPKAAFKRSNLSFFFSFFFFSGGGGKSGAGASERTGWAGIWSSKGTSICASLSKMSRSSSLRWRAVSSPSLTMSTGRLMVRNRPINVVPVRIITATKSSNTTTIRAPTKPAAWIKGKPKIPPITPPPVPELSVYRYAMYSQRFNSSGIFRFPKMNPVAQKRTITTTVIQTFPLMEPRGFSMAVITAT